MGPFLTIRRHAVVDLPEPWDPSRIIQEYLDDSAIKHELVLSEEQRSTLAKDGVLVRIDAKHRWMGAMAGEMRIAVLDALTVEIDIDGWATLRWWLRPFALPFRPRMRRAIETQVDELIEDLTTETDEAAGGFEHLPAEPLLETGEPSAPARDRSQPLKGLNWTLRVLTIGGDLVYQRAQNGTGPM